MSRDFIHGVKSMVPGLCRSLTVILFQAACELTTLILSLAPGTKLRDTRFGDLHARVQCEAMSLLFHRAYSPAATLSSHLHPPLLPPSSFLPPAQPSNPHSTRHLLSSSFSWNTPSTLPPSFPPSLPRHFPSFLPAASMEQQPLSYPPAYHVSTRQPSSEPYAPPSMHRRDEQPVKPRTGSGSGSVSSNHLLSDAERGGGRSGFALPNKEGDYPEGWTKEDEEAEREFMKRGMVDWDELKSWRFWIRKEWWCASC